MLVSTTDTVQGYKVDEYLPVVGSEVIYGANLFRDFFAGLRDMVGGRSGMYEEVIQKAREEAMRELQERAQKLGANAILGVEMDVEFLGQNASMIMVTMQGTPCKVTRDQPLIANVEAANFRTPAEENINTR